MVKKAQGALEFLMTYGWAFLVILIMIGALAYFGILDPSRFLPDRCDLGTQVLCKKDAFIVNNLDPNTVVASVTNNAGSTIAIYGATATTDGGNIGSCTALCFDNVGGAPDGACGGGGDADLTGAVGAAVTWPAGEPRTLNIACTGSSLTPGDKTKFLISYKWYATSAGPSFTKDGAGEIYATVQ